MVVIGRFSLAVTAGKIVTQGKCLR